MFSNLSDNLSGVFKRLRGKGYLSEADVTAAMREVRIALLEADVALPIVKDFIATVKEQAIGEEVVKSVSPAQMVIKIVSDELTNMLGEENESLNLATTPPAVILMCGLQGSGKTTTTGKLARILNDKENKKTLMASLDIYRPAAQEQLATLGEQLNIDTLDIVAGEKPETITKRALKEAKLGGYDVLMLDTAGRLHVDGELMSELKAVKKLSNPVESILVADSLTGQDAVNLAQQFQEQIGVTGIILTRVDGDARGGAALSMKAVTGCPIKFLGTGEKLTEIEPFHPERVANRILGMGDVVSLVEKASEQIDQEEAEKLAKKLKKGKFDFNDLNKQFNMMKKMGGIGGLMNMLPGMGKMKAKIDEAGMDDSVITRQQAIIQSMTNQERENPTLMNASRKRRIAAGSGSSVQDVNRLLKMMKQMGAMMKKAGKMDKKQLARMGGIEGLLPKN